MTPSDVRLDQGHPLAALVGRVVALTRSVTEADVLGFAEISGDRAPHHVDEDYVRMTSMGRRVAHGALLIGYASAASTAMSEQAAQHVVSVGYDRVRFIKPVFIGDVVTVRYSVTDYDPAKRRTIAQIEITNQEGQLVAVANHLLQAWDD